MKYLSTQQQPRLSTITIRDRQEVDFTVPPDVAMIVFWFLASTSAQLIALIAWWAVYGLRRRYCGLCDYLAGLKGDLVIMRLALLRLLPDLLTVQVANCFG